MATFRNGPNGGFSGKVGSVVGSSWKGIDYIRSLPTKRKTKAGSEEQNNRSKFGFVQLWLHPFKPFYNIGFMNFSKRATANNIAVSFTLKNAVKGEAPDFYIDYPSVLLSDGPLQPAVNPQLSFTGINELKLIWEVVYQKKAKADDDLLFIAYCPELEMSYVSIGDAFRSNREVEIKLPKQFEGLSLEVYIAFTSSSRKLVSRSQYLGKI